MTSKNSFLIILVAETEVEVAAVEEGMTKAATTRGMMGSVIGVKTFAKG